MEAYIREQAPKYGIDPKIAVKVAKAEGLNKVGEHLGFVTKDPLRFSYGPFQLRMDGYGNKFDFGKFPTNLNWKAQIDYALNIAKHQGWGGWWGAADVGILDYCGINGGKCDFSLDKLPTPHHVTHSPWHPHHSSMPHTIK